MKEPKDLEVSKSNSLVRAGYRLTAIEQQMILFAIAQARESQTGLSADKQVSINARAFADTFGIPHSNVYRQLAEGVEALFNRFITFHHKDVATGKGARTKTRWISDATYVDGEGEIRMHFAPLIIPHLMRLEPGFTRYVLKDMAALTSGHAIRLYELLIQYKSTGWAKVSKPDLRFAFGLTDTEYPLTNDFKRYVLNVAVKQINDLTTLRVVATPTRKGKAIIGWEFRFYEEPLPEPVDVIEKAELPPFDDAWIAARARPGESGQEARARLYPIYKREVLLIDDNQVEMAL